MTNNFMFINTLVSISSVLYMLYAASKIKSLHNPTEEKILWFGIVTMSLFTISNICEMILASANIKIPFDTKTIYQISDFLCSFWGIITAWYFLKIMKV